MPAPLVKIDLDGLEEGRLLASRASGRTLSLPLEHDPATGAAYEPMRLEGHDLADLGEGWKGR
jgi:hypothetical protein